MLEFIALQKFNWQRPNQSVVELVVLLGGKNHNNA